MSDRCDEVVTELHTYLDGEVGPEYAALISEHLADCPPCEDRAEFERRVRELVASKCTECAPPQLRDRIQQLFSG